VNIESLTLVVTEDCNFDCTYCYKKKRPDRMTSATARKALSFFWPFLTGRCGLNFYGGEPLLCFDLIKETLAFLAEKNREYGKKPQYSLTTNGSLITQEILQTLDAHAFSLVFSFDGYAQETHRKKGSFDQAVSNIKKILGCSNIKFEVNSVFTPVTVDRISDSMALIMDMGVKDINLSLARIQPWDSHSLERLKEELADLRKILIAHHRKTREIPVLGFRKRDTAGYFTCAGGQDRMAVTSEEHVWGCDLFADYFQGKEHWPAYHDYFFGTLDTFAENHKKIYPKISSNYAGLSMENFATPHRECLVCLDLENCSVCPVAAALAGVSIGEIPAYMCAIQKIRMEARQKFLEEILE
jgi:sulfatase maturation enzyme AslB (radical SAM superfamily)